METTKSSIAKRYTFAPTRKSNTSLVLPVITKTYITRHPGDARAKSLINLKPKSTNADLASFESSTLSRIMNKINAHCPPNKFRLLPKTDLTEQLNDTKTRIEMIISSLAASKIETKSPVSKEKVPSRPKAKSAVKYLEKSEKKHVMFSEFINKIRLSNAMVLDDIGTKFYNFYVGAGNNSDLIRRTLRKRYWWMNCDSIKRSHFVWTPLKNKKLLCKLPNSKQNFKIKKTLSNSKPSEEYKAIGFAHVTNSEPFQMLEPVLRLNNLNAKVCNKLLGNKHLCTKKYLYHNLKKFYKDEVFNVIPLTFHISKGKNDPALLEFEEEYNRRNSSSVDNIWIVKPAERTNRGKGISVCHSLEEVRKIVYYPTLHTFIIQKYIENPLLIENRKFDIRCFALMTCFNGKVQGYFYQDGYIRTSGYQYTAESKNRLIHLTNDAVQKYSKDYGKYENGNKLSYIELQKYMDRMGMNVNLFEEILPQIKKTVKDSFSAVKGKIDFLKKDYCFELFGYDFMIDQNFKPWLIEINTNPCLEENCPLLASLLGALIENTFNITIDTIFPPNFSSKKSSNWVNDHIRENKYELVFSE